MSNKNINPTNNLIQRTT